MLRFVLPSLKWFESEMEYSESFGTDPERGCMNVTTFHCKVRIVDLRGENKLCAVCWYTLPWKAETCVDEMIIGYFETTEAGVEAAGNWIRRKCFYEGADRLTVPANVPLMPHKMV